VTPTYAPHGEEEEDPGAGDGFAKCEDCGEVVMVMDFRPPIVCSECQHRRNIVPLDQAGGKP
jgi:acetyl-CoA carboxylase beta subunit